MSLDKNFRVEYSPDNEYSPLKNDGFKIALGKTHFG